MSKLFETTIFDSVNDSVTSVDYQFGFRPSYSTAICTKVFKQVTDYTILNVVGKFLRAL